MKVFNVDWNRLLLLLLPTFLRKAKIYLLLTSAMDVIRDIYYRLTTFREVTRLAIERNGQVCKLRGMLNGRFDSLQKRITVEDISRREYLMIYTDLSDRFIEMGTVEIWKEAYVGTEIADFVVNVPEEYQHEDEQLKSLISKYKLASKRYIINYLNTI